MPQGHAMNKYGGVEVKLHIFVNPEIYGGE
jgi:hypothetical protein